MVEVQKPYTLKAVNAKDKGEFLLSREPLERVSRGRDEDKPHSRGVIGRYISLYSTYKRVGSSKYERG
jgi:hypothetical protein